jgi:hypothetical protein
MKLNKLSQIFESEAPLPEDDEFDSRFSTFRTDEPLPDEDEFDGHDDNWMICASCGEQTFGQDYSECAICGAALCQNCENRTNRCDDCQHEQDIEQAYEDAWLRNQGFREDIWDTDEALPDEDEFGDNPCAGKETLAHWMNKLNARITDNAINVLNAYGNEHEVSYAIEGDYLDLPSVKDSVSLTRWVLTMCDAFGGVHPTRILDPREQVVWCGGDNKDDIEDCCFLKLIDGEWILERTYH